jgi:hypothetical protein
VNSDDEKELFNVVYGPQYTCMIEAQKKWEGLNEKQQRLSKRRGKTGTILLPLEAVKEQRKQSYSIF